MRQRLGCATSVFATGANMKFIVTALCLLGLTADFGFAAASAEPNDPPRITTGTPAFTRQIIATGVSQTHAVVTADLDGDGDLDAVATDYVAGAVYWYENDGSQNFVAHVLDGGLTGAYPAAVADLDLDNDMDVLATGYLADTVVWYENDGAGNFSRHDVDTAADGAHSVVAVDLDQDGDRDLLTTNQDEGAIVWYENDGLLNFTRHTIGTGAVSAKRAESADLDGDNDLDVVACSYDTDEVAWFENDGNENFTKHVISTAADGAYYVSLGDLNGDGAQDILSASRLDATIAWYENNGTGNFTARDIDTAALGARMVLAVDMDRDGDLDALSTSVSDNTVGWYENDGSGNFVKRAVDHYVRGAYGVCAADMNHGGSTDVMSAGRDDGNVALHLQFREHRAVLVAPGGTLALGLALLHTQDADDAPADLTYTLTLAPLAGAIQRDGLPVPAGDTFTQADINAGLVEYAHDGSSVFSDEFAFTVADQGEDGVMPAEGTFMIYVADPVLAHWPLDEASGGVAADVVGTSDGTLLAGPVWQPAGGQVGGALMFDGADARVDIGTLDVAGGDGLTATMWIRPQVSGSAGRLLSKASGTAEQDHYWMISTLSGAQLRFRLRTRDLTSTLIAPQPVLTAGQWLFVACTYDGNEMRIYADGVLLVSLPKSGAVDTNPLITAAIGNQPSGAGNESFDGLIDDVRLYNRALLPAELLALMTQGDVTAVDDRSGDNPTGDCSTCGLLLENAPNPFNPMTTIRFETRRAGTVALTVFDLRGHRVRALVTGHREAGLHEVVWDGRDDQGRAASSGVYAYRLDAGGISQVRRMLLVR